MNIDHWWLHNAIKVVGHMLHRRSHQKRMFTYGSDCSGLDAPFWAFRQIAEMFKALVQRTVGCYADRTRLAVQLTV